MNPKMDRERPELHPIPVKSPWYHIGMDFIGPMSPPSEMGNRYILTISDYFTKYAWAKALPTKEAAGVVSAMREVRFSYVGFTCVHVCKIYLSYSLSILSFRVICIIWYSFCSSCFWCWAYLP